MRFALLGSGSAGNGLVVEHAGTRLLIDCGFTLKETERRLGRLGLSGSELDAVLVTHEHGDHLGGVGPLARKHKVPVWLTHGTGASAAARLGEVPAVEYFNSHEAFSIGELEVRPYPVPHDAREPAQFVFGDGQYRLGILTDAGMVTPHIEAQLSGCDALVMESNHDERMLAEGPYPPRLQARVGGNWGHLSNAQAGALLQKLDVSRLQHIVAAHLSEKNNLPALARQVFAEALDCAEEWIAVAGQDEGLGWRALG